MSTELLNSALAKISSANTESALEAVELELVGRKQGVLTEAMKALKDLEGERRKERGESLNKIKQEIEKAIGDKRSELKKAAWATAAESERVDVSQPALPKKQTGHFHPNTIIQKSIEDLFTSMGFMIFDGPEIESDYYNFTALNIPPTHPARDSQDSFYLKGRPEFVMRTQTSNMQIRGMQKYGAPIRAVIPGKCFRNESTDVRHEHTFYQLEGYIVDKNITFADMKGVLETVAKHLYGPETKVRLRPKYYPFVEPGVNGEVTCFVCKGVGCRLCKHSGWLEIFGAGMIHPNVLKEAGVDSKVYQGFAFGLGLTRLVMLKYGIEDIRLLESGDMKFLEQF